MNTFRQELLSLSREFPQCFHSVFQFGSSLYNDHPEDIDVLAIYDHEEAIDYVIEQRWQLLDMLVPKFAGVIVDLVTLSDVELRESGFFSKTRCELIKGFNSP